MKSNENSANTKFATKEDIMKLELTMRAGFETLAYSINILLSLSPKNDGDLERIKASIANTHNEFSEGLAKTRALLASEREAHSLQE